MLIHIPGVLDRDAVRQWRERLTLAPWTDGRVTAGHQSSRVKRNMQIPEDDPLAIQFGDELATRLGRTPEFVSAALPKRIYPPMLSRYQASENQHFGTHVDNAIRYDKRGTIRADLSSTLFLSDLDEYEGGELTIEDNFGARKLRFPAGDMVLYPSSSLHSVAPLTRGERFAAVLWTQSLIRDPVIRESLYTLDQNIRALAADAPEDPRVLSLTNVYHNLVRHHAEP
nr:Fe2+-dependent dioxygenase [uncultured Neokomagataea sp.]